MLIESVLCVLLKLAIVQQNWAKTLKFPLSAPQSQLYLRLLGMALKKKQEEIG